MDNDFRYLLRVRFSECDGQNVVFNARYVEYVDVAVTEYMRHMWGDHKEVLASGTDSQVVNVNVSWKQSASFDDVLVISLKTAKLGNSSFTLVAEFRNYETDELIANAEVVYVMVSAGDHKKMTIPQHLREQLECGAPGVVVNHAGV